MRCRSLVLAAVMAAACLGSALADSGQLDSVVRPKVNAVVPLGEAASSAVEQAERRTYSAIDTALKPAKKIWSTTVANKTAPVASLAQQKGAIFFDKLGNVIGQASSAHTPLIKNLTAPAVKHVLDNVGAVQKQVDGVVTPVKVALGTPVAKKINATAGVVDAALAAKLSKAMPAVNHVSDQVTEHLKVIQGDVDGLIDPLQQVPSQVYFDAWGVIIDNTTLHTAAGPIKNAVDGLIASKSEVLDGPVRESLSPLHNGVSTVLNHVALQMEGPIAKQVKPVRDAARGVVARVSDFVDGPGYNISKPIRQAANHAITGLASFLEGNHSEWAPEPTPNAGAFINHIGDAVGRVMPTGIGRIGSAMFGIIPKPTPINPNMPKLPNDPVVPTSLDGTGKPSGVCKPWEKPEGYRNVLDFCQAMQQLPREHFQAEWNKTTPPKFGEEFPLSGCVFGCLVSNDAYTRAQIETSVMFGWSGKCFGEERKNGVPTRFATTLNHDYLIPSGRTQEQRIPAYNGAGEMIFFGEGKYNPKGYYDGKPTWHFDDNRPNVTAFTHGSWRTLNTLFQAWADGVVDEFRDLGNGQVIGKTYYTPPFFHNRARADTNFFYLFQACTADGKVPWRPEDRQVPQIGDDK